jgi:transcription antitermination factor NusG
MDRSRISVFPPPDEKHAWIVLHARPRCEKKVAEFCVSRDIFHYLPLLSKKHRYGNRIRTFEVPLFTGYIFVLATNADKTLLRQNDRVANVLSVLDQATLLSQLDQVRRALEHHETMELFPHLATGMKVQVRSGPLKGVEGFIHKIKNKTKIVLNIDFIRQSVAVEVDAEWLVPV